MGIPIFTFLSILLAAGFSSLPANAAPDENIRVQMAQYRGDRDRYDDRDRDWRGNDNRGRYNDQRGGNWGPRDGRLWRPGEVVPQSVMTQTVRDWEERGLQRPPGGHEWFRIGQQFVLIRYSDQMISRILNFHP